MRQRSKRSPNAREVDAMRARVVSLEAQVAAV